MAGADLPEMQVRHTVAVGFETLANIFGNVCFGRGVQQHRAGIAQQPVSPAYDDNAADKAHRRIGPGPFREHRNQQCRDGQNGGCRIGQHMQIGGAQIVVAVMVVVVFAVVIVVMIFP